MKINFIITGLAAIIPMIIGFIWYNQKVFGGSWMKETGLTIDDTKKTNMLLVFGLSLFFSFLISLEMNLTVIHQFHLYSIIANDPDLLNPNSVLNITLSDFMAKYGQNYRTFKHGAFHGALAGIFLVLPAIGTNALFEQKSFKYIAINAGYWIVSLTLMGGFICALT